MKPELRYNVYLLQVWHLHHDTDYATFGGPHQLAGQDEHGEDVSW